jgi:hypothetical protein
MKTIYYKPSKNKQELYAALQVLDPTREWRVRIDESDEQTRLQQEKYHAMLGDIARQAKHVNKVLDLDSWKRLCVKQFADDCIANDLPRLADYWKRQNFTVVPSLDGKSLVTLGKQTRDFPKYVAAGFIEWLYHYGAENEIEWSEPEERWDGRYAA